MSLYFWWAVGFVYLGLFLGFIDVQCEPWFGKHVPARVLASAILILLGILFGFGIVFRSAPLEIDAIIQPGGYADGTVIAGVRWLPEFTDLRIMLRNPTSIDYDSFEALIETDASIVHITEVSNSGVLFEGDVTKEVVDIGGVIAKMPTITKPDAGGAVVSIPARQLSAPRYRIRGKLYRDSSIQLALVIAEIDKAKTRGVFAMAPADPPGDTSLPATLLGPSDGSSAVFYKRHKPTTVRIRARYKAALKPMGVDRTVDIFTPER